MKKQRKFMSLLFLFLIIGNLVVTDTSFIVNATGSNKVEDIIDMMKKRIQSIDQKCMSAQYYDDNTKR